MIELRLPSLGSDMDEGKLVQWQVLPGDAVKKGQVVAVVDTAKAAVDVECWHDGTVHALLAEPGATIPVGTLMAVLRAPGESADEAEQALAALRAATAPAAAAPVAVVAAAAPPGAVTVAPPGERPRVSPLARRRARELGIDPAPLVGHGVDGAVTLADVERAAAARMPAQAPSRAQQMRQVIAAAMSRSKREIPHYYLSEDLSFERAAAWLAARNAGLPVTARLLPAALLLKATALALRRYPEFNGFHRDGVFVAGAGIHLGVAVSLRGGGLVSPALLDADRPDVAMLTRALLDLVQRARAGALRSSELGAATCTVTNLGDQGVTSVFGVIHPPQVALVGFGRIAPRPWVRDDGTLGVVPALTATLAADHRASDGHRGALLLAEIGERLQQPESLDRAGG